MYPWPENVVPILIMLVGLMTPQFEQSVPGATMKPYSGYRTQAEQTAYYAQGRLSLAQVNEYRRTAGLDPISASENRHRITLAPPGESTHNRSPSPAVDIVVVCHGKELWAYEADCDEDGVSDYLEMGRIGEKVGLVWGGRWRGFPDIGHLEVPEEK